MRRLPILTVLAIVLTSFLSFPTEGHSQMDRLRRAARRTATNAATLRVERLMNEAIRCAIDRACKRFPASGL